MGVIQIPINENEMINVEVPEYIEAAYLILHDTSKSELEQFTGMLEALGINSIQFKKKIRNWKIQKEYLHNMELIRAAGKKPVKSLARQILCKKYNLSIRQLRKILKK